MKTIDTLVEDIYEVVSTRGGWDATITAFISDELGATFKSRLEDEAEDRTGALRMSSMGRPCKRQLWYKHNSPHTGEALPSQTMLKFLYGDMVETLVLALAKAAGHDVRGMQDELAINGVTGHRDCVIDGVTIDVKTASEYSFGKFKDGLNSDTDGFGYLGQLRAYVAAGAAADPTVESERGGFLVVNKVSGAICLDMHTFKGLTLEQMEKEYAATQALVEQAKPPARGFDDEPDGYKNKTKGFVTNGNRYLKFNCAYCEYKKECWPGLRTFLYKGQNGFKPKHFTKVVKVPNVQEVDG